MDIQPVDLRYFFEIAKTCNISRAAERLGVGQPALSQSLQRLERAVGAKLFDRFKTGVELTRSGQNLLIEGRVALETWGRLSSSVVSSHQEIQGKYSVGCHPAVGSYAISSWLRPLLIDHPRLEIELKHGLSREILEGVVSFNIDFGLVMNPTPHPDLVIKNLCVDHVFLFAAPGAIADVLIFDPALQQSRKLIQKLAKKMLAKRFIHSSSLELIAKLAAAGCGTAILPQRIAKQYANLSRSTSEPWSVKDNLCLIYRADRTQTMAGKKIIQAIVSSTI